MATGDSTSSRASITVGGSLSSRSVADVARVVGGPNGEISDAVYSLLSKSTKQMFIDAAQKTGKSVDQLLGDTMNMLPQNTKLPGMPSAEHSFVAALQTNNDRGQGRG